MNLWQPCYNDPFLRPACRICTVCFWSVALAALVFALWTASLLVRLFILGWWS